MKYLKHNIIENFKESPRKEKAQILVDEMSKAYMLYPKATADILDSCDVQYESLHPKHLAKAIKNNSGNLKMLNRVIRLTFLVNQLNDVDMKKHNRDKSFREVMQNGAVFLKQHPNELKHATLMARDMMKENRYSEILKENVTQYLNLDGQQLDPVSEKSNKTNWGAIIIVGLIAFGMYSYYKSRKS